MLTLILCRISDGESSCEEKIIIKDNTFVCLALTTKWYIATNVSSYYEYYMNDEGSISKLSVVSSEKDLGVWITSKPDFTL